MKPVITARMIGFHHGKHHNAYVDNLNKLVAGTEYAALSLEKIIAATAGQPEKSAIFNNAAQIWNHTFYRQSRISWRKMVYKGKRQWESGALP